MAFRMRGIHQFARDPRRGFTLMEIVVVVVIIGIMVAVALPSMRGMAENNRLRSSVRELMNLMKYARSEAVFNARTTEVFLDTEKHEYWLDLRKPDEKTGKYDPKAPKTNMERRRALENGVRFKSVNALNQNILDKGVIAVDFFPDGTASPVLFSVTNARDVQYTIEVFKPTGIVELNKGDLETALEKQQSLEYPLPEGYNDLPADSGQVASSR